MANEKEFVVVNEEIFPNWAKGCVENRLKELWAGVGLDDLPIFYRDENGELHELAKYHFKYDPAEFFGIDKKTVELTATATYIFKETGRKVTEYAVIG